MLKSMFLAIPFILAGSAAIAASDLTVGVSGPTSPTVYTPANYSVVVNNIGNQTASSVTLTVTLPGTGSSPTNMLLGILGPTPSGCTRTGLALNCNLGNIARRGSKSVNFAFSPAWSSGAVAIQASVATTSNENSTANNSASIAIAPASVATTIDASGGPVLFDVSHCTGTGLTSFFICTLFPSSLGAHEALYSADGSISFPNEDQAFTGSWSQPNANTLYVTYFENGNVVGTFVGNGVGDGCFEGLMSFIPDNGYNAGYEICPR